MGNRNPWSKVNLFDWKIRLQNYINRRSIEEVYHFIHPGDFIFADGNHIFEQINMVKSPFWILFLNRGNQFSLCDLVKLGSIVFLVQRWPHPKNHLLLDVPLPYLLLEAQKAIQAFLIFNHKFSLRFNLGFKITSKYFTLHCQSFSV